MNFTTIILNILFLSSSFKESRMFNNITDIIEIESKKSLYYKQTLDTIKPNNKNLNLLVRGKQNYDIILTSIKKEDYEEAKQNQTSQLLDETIIPSQVNLTESCYTVETPIKIEKACLDDDDELLNIFYSGFIKKLNSCVISEQWFEVPTLSNKVINLDNGAITYVDGNELIFSPNLKFIYSPSFVEGISLYQIMDKKIYPILKTDWEIEEKYKFEFYNFGKAYWVSDSCFYAKKNEGYYKFKIQDKLITYKSEVKKNIIHSENSKFIIKVDELKDGTIRYTSWNKPKTANDRPSLVLYNGDVEQQTKYGSGFDYRFQNGEYLYILENNIETTSDRHLMLRLYKNNEELLYTSLTYSSEKK